jgi:hypothetical protein
MPSPRGRLAQLGKGVAVVDDPEGRKRSAEPVLARVEKRDAGDVGCAVSLQQPRVVEVHGHGDRGARPAVTAQLHQPAAEEEVGASPRVAPGGQSGFELGFEHALDGRGAPGYEPRHAHGRAVGGRVPAIEAPGELVSDALVVRRDDRELRHGCRGIRARRQGQRDREQHGDARNRSAPARRLHRDPPSACATSAAKAPAAAETPRAQSCSSGL